MTGRRSVAERVHVVEAKKASVSGAPEPRRSPVSITVTVVPQLGLPTVVLDVGTPGAD